MPKIITSDTVKLFSYNAISILVVISNHNSFRVLLDKIASVYFVGKIRLYFWHWKWPARGTSTVPVVSAHFRSLLR